jgi:isopenicillin-N epimerase
MRAIMWTLDPSITFLNHGSFGACPEEVLRVQSELRAHLEREPVRFFVRELEERLDAARAAVASFVGADADDLAFVNNATTGVNTVLRSLRFGPGDEVLITSHTYAACKNALDRVIEGTGASVVIAEIPFPGTTRELVEEAIIAKASDRTRLALIDHVTSPTGLVFPIERIVRRLGERGIDVLVDGAHAPGMVPLDLRALGVAYYTGNCHKWLCAPKGAALLFVKKDRQSTMRPLVTSHGASSTRTDRSRFRLDFDWNATDDPTAFLSVPHAIRFLGTLLEGGWPALMARNRELALSGRRILLDALQAEAPAPDDMIGTLATVPLPSQDAIARTHIDPLQDELFYRWGIEVPVFSWPTRGRRFVRISAQYYNEVDQYRKLAHALQNSLHLH